MTLLIGFAVALIAIALLNWLPRPISPPSDSVDIASFAAFVVVQFLLAPSGGLQQDL